VIRFCRTMLQSKVPKRSTKRKAPEEGALD